MAGPPNLHSTAGFQLEDDRDICTTRRQDSGHNNRRTRGTRSRISRRSSTWTTSRATSEALDLSTFDYVVVLDKSIAKHLKVVPQARLIVWHVNAPYGDDLSEYRRCALTIGQQVSTLSL